MPSDASGAVCRCKKIEPVSEAHQTDSVTNKAVCKTVGNYSATKRVEFIDYRSWLQAFSKESPEKV